MNSLVVHGRELLGARPFVIAGPCVLERRDLAFEIVGALKEILDARSVPFVFKASFDKANRSSLSSGRGVGMQDGLAWLAEIRAEYDVPVLTDVHLPEQCAPAGEAVDILQIPAFLCRQTDLLVAAAETGAVVNIKKGQFVAPWDIAHAARKVTDSGNERVLLTERGTSFGYGRLVVDMSGFHHMKASGFPLVFDATHSVQEPGGRGDKTGGDRERVPALARAAIATGEVDGLFFEVHPDPDSSPSDGPNMLRLDSFAEILDGVLAVADAVRPARG